MLNTRWVQILVLDELLSVVNPNPVVALNRVVALAMVHGPAAGLTELDSLRAGEPDAEREYERASLRTLNLPERRYLEQRADRLRARGDEGLP